MAPFWPSSFFKAKQTHSAVPTASPDEECMALLAASQDEAYTGDASATTPEPTCQQQAPEDVSTSLTESQSEVSQEDDDNELSDAQDFEAQGEGKEGITNGAPCMARQTSQAAASTQVPKLHGLEEIQSQSPMGRQTLNALGHTSCSANKWSVMGKVRGGTLLIMGQISHGILYVKVLWVEGHKIVTSRAIMGYAAVKTCVLMGCARIEKAAKGLPIPISVTSAIAHLERKIGDVLVHLQGGHLYIYGTTADMMLLVKAKLAACSDAVQKQTLRALHIFACVKESVAARVKCGLLTGTGMVHGATVYIMTTIATTHASTAKAARETLTRMREVVERLPLARHITACTSFVAGRANSVVVSMKDGCVHAASKSCGAVVYIRARITTMQGCVKVQIIETYASSERLARTIVKCMFQCAARAKAKTSKSPVASSAIGGAVLAGTGGGAFGGVAGGLAGAAVGLPLAIFTFGFSIPICTAVGGSVGACAGMATGGAVGAVGSGVFAYRCNRKAQIKG